MGYKENVLLLLKLWKGEKMWLKYTLILLLRELVRLLSLPFSFIASIWASPSAKARTRKRKQTLRKMRKTYTKSLLVCLCLLTLAACANQKPVSVVANGVRINVLPETINYLAQNDSGALRDINTNNEILK
jgi:hypothetical protein